MRNGRSRPFSRVLSSPPPTPKILLYIVQPQKQNIPPLLPNRAVAAGLEVLAGEREIKPNKVENIMSTSSGGNFMQFQARCNGATSPTPSTKNKEKKGTAQNNDSFLKKEKKETL